MSTPTIRNSPEAEAQASSNALPTQQIKPGDAIKTIGQSVQGFELKLTRDKTPTDAAIFE